VTPGEGEKAALVEDPGTPFLTVDHVRGTRAGLLTAYLDGGPTP
jgi:hypothetical protein